MRGWAWEHERDTNCLIPEFYFCLSIYTFNRESVCVCVCVCVRERERERERGGERERESECVSE